MSSRFRAPQYADGKLPMGQYDVMDLILRQAGSIAELSYIGSRRRVGTRGEEQ